MVKVIWIGVLALFLVTTGVCAATDEEAKNYTHVNITTPQLQRMLFYTPYTTIQEETYYFPQVDKPLERCNSSVGTCIVDAEDNRTFYIEYIAGEKGDKFFIIQEKADITIWDVDGYANFAELDITVINLGVYLSVPEFGIKRAMPIPKAINYIFKLEYGMDETKWITGVRYWWVLLIVIPCALIGVKHLRERKK